MTKVISFISRKGGTGKTTNAINLCTMMANLGHKVLLIETDTNYTLSTVRAMDLQRTGAKKNGKFQIVGSEDEKVISDIEYLKEQGEQDVVVVDSAGKTTDANIRRLCLVSDLVIVPTTLTQNDMLVTYQTVEDLKPALEHNPGLKIRLLPNRIHSSTKLATIKEALADVDAEVLNNPVPQKNIFANFSTLLAEKEYLPITKEIVGLIEL